MRTAAHRCARQLVAAWRDVLRRTQWEHCHGVICSERQRSSICKITQGPREFNEQATSTPAAASGDDFASGCNTLEKAPWGAGIARIVPCGAQEAVVALIYCQGPQQRPVEYRYGALVSNIVGVQPGMVLEIETAPASIYAANDCDERSAGHGRRRARHRPQPVVRDEARRLAEHLGVAGAPRRGPHAARRQE